MAYAEDAQMINPVKGGLSTEHVAGALVLVSLAFLWLVARGFRGISVGGASVGIR